MKRISVSVVILLFFGFAALAGQAQTATAPGVSV